MKIVLQPIGVTSIPTPVPYKVPGNRLIEYENETAFPINAVLAKTMQKGERVRIIRLLSESGDCKKFADGHKDELDKINEKICADISYVDVVEKFAEDNETQEKRFKKILEKLEPDAEIYTDITYGQKPFPILLLSICTFAEKFLNCEIQKIVYGSVEYDKTAHLPKKETAVVYDVTAMYHLINLVSIMEAPDSKTAAERLERFFAL